MAQGKKRVAVIYGSRSVEHDISIITAHQVMAALDRTRYELLPVYITRAGAWYTHPALFTGNANADLAYHRKLIELEHSETSVALPPDPAIGGLLVPAISGLLARTRVTPIDVAIPVIHGTFGEDGTLQGLLELADIPYVGSGVPGSAVGMDKLLTKAVLQAHGIPAVPYVGFSRREWQRDPEALLQRVQDELGLPVFVKPANLGSSIGISKATTPAELREAIEVARHYDRRVLVERAVAGAQEINCAVLGNDEPIPSVCEQPVSWNTFLNFADKYMHDNAEGMKGAQRRIPAPISDALTQHIQQLAVAGFRALHCRGMARVDFLIDPADETVYLNEINTTPGSFAFYLWSASDIRPTALLNRLIDLALEAHAEKRETTFSYTSGVLAGSAISMGSKGSKGSKI